MAGEYAFLYILGRPDEALIKAKKDRFVSEADMNMLLQQAGQPLHGTVIPTYLVPRE